MRKIAFRTMPALKNKAVEVFLKTNAIDPASLMLGLPEISKEKGVIINSMDDKLPYWAYPVIVNFYKQNLFVAIPLRDYVIVSSNSNDYPVNTTIRLCETCGEEIATNEVKRTRFGLVHADCYENILEKLREELDEELSLSLSATNYLLSIRHSHS